MKKMRKNTKPMLSCIVMALICVMGTITAFAYEAPSKHVSDDIDWESECTFSVSDGMEDVEQLACDYFFMDKEGNVTCLQNLPQKILCKHNYVEGTTKYHAKNSNGGCTVTIKSAKMCKFCKDILVGDVISEHTYTVCPH